MATAPAATFSDSQCKLAVPSAPSPDDTLVDVNNDPVRRNKLIDDNNLLKGVRMTTSGPQSSTRDLIVRPNKLNVNVNQTATIETTTVEAEYTETLMQSNYTSVSIKVSSPYATANADYSTETSYKNTETEKTIMVSSRYLFPQGRIDLSPPGTGYADDVQLSPAFLKAVSDALAKPTKLEQREALDAIFKDYGEVYRTKVRIGGTLSAHTMETFKRSENEKTVKEDVKAGLEGSVKGWGAGVTAGHGNTETTITTQQGRKLSVKYIVTGGDYTKIQETTQWIASTNDTDYWRVIEVGETIAVVDMLPDPIKSTVKALMTPLLGRWVSVERVPGTDKYPVGIYRPQGVVPNGWFWLGHAADSSRALIVKPTLPPKSGRNYAVTMGSPGAGFTDQPFPNQPEYAFFSTYFGGFSAGVAPGTTLCALRPGLFLDGQWELHGTAINTSVYITRPASSQDPEDECLDLKPVVKVTQTGVDNPPRPRWALRKNVVLFDSD
ncbi:pleurotolysin B precursor [Lentinus tigrinus ALCF2SS1-7]|uniref:pleurotolysin B precursor n=1 Tax=Lentinus tigrinus ALCF2SS1-7 TaxID=1328758 RepID=UPI0011662012|nr:pleurotolysin B precursor [Lentinus tigrinus ALCF2SS1-7]